jgi:hypothetical protein
MIICKKKVLGIGQFVIYFWSLYPAVVMPRPLGREFFPVPRIVY